MWIIRLGIFETTFFIWYGMVSKMCCFHRIGWWFLWGRFLCPKKGLPFSPQNTERTFQAGPKFPSQCYQLGMHGSSATTLLVIWVCQKKSQPPQKSKITKNLWVPGSSRPILPCWLFQHVSIILFSIFTHSWDDDTIDFILIEMGRLNPNIFDIIVSRVFPWIIINPLMITWLFQSNHSWLSMMIL